MDDYRYEDITLQPVVFKYTLTAEEYKQFAEMDWKPVYTNNVIDFFEAHKRLRATKQNNASAPSLHS